MNNEETYYPKKGWFIKNDKFPRTGGYSFSLGLAREQANHYLEGYERPTTHKGHETYFYLFIYNRQFVIGYKSCKEVSE